MTKKEFKMRLLIVIGVSGLLLVVLGISIGILSYDIKGRARVIQDYKKELRAATEASLSLLSLQADFEHAKPYVSVLENILPIRDQLISFPKDLAFVAQKNKIASAVSFGAETLATDKVPGFVRFSMTLDGPYDNILKFMQEVERGKYIIDWSNIDFISDNKSYKGTIFGRVFFQ